MNLYKKLTPLFITSIFVVILAFFHLKGLIYYDEGYILHSALRVLRGEIPYKDFDFVYTPISILTVSAFLQIFGESVFSGRLASLTFSLLSLFPLYRILSMITKNKLLIILSLFFFIGWGTAHINFPWPTMFAIGFLLYTMFFYLQGVIQKNNKYFYISGIFVILTLLSKQNFGAGILLMSLVSFFFLKSKKTYIFYYLLGVISAVLVSIILFIYTSSLTPFIENLYDYTYKRILIQKVLDTPFIYEGSLFLKIAKLIFYTSPLTLSFFAFYISRSSKKELLIIPCFIATIYILGIRPTTDYNHFVPLLSLANLPLAIIIEKEKKPLFRTVSMIILIGGVLFSFYSAYFRGHYRWGRPLSENVYFSSNPRIKVYLNQQTDDQIEQLTKYITLHTKPNEPIYIHYYSPLIYFVADRRNAIRYDYISFSDTPLSSQKLARDQLEKKNVKLVIIHNINKMERPPIADYIRRKYRVSKVIGDYTILAR